MSVESLKSVANKGMDFRNSTILSKPETATLLAAYVRLYYTLGLGFPDNRGVQLKIILLLRRLFMRLSKLFAAWGAVVIFCAALLGAPSGVTFKKDTDRI